MCEDSEQSNNSVACFGYSSHKYSGYNFQGAAVSVNVLTDLTTKGLCLKGKPQIINGRLFKYSEDSGVGLGNIKEQHFYRTYHDSKCYEVQMSMALTNFGNYDRGTIKEFKHSDKEQVYEDLNRVVETLRFLK